LLQRAHDEHAQTQRFRQRQDFPLRSSAQWVVRDLDHVESLALYQRRHLTKRGLLVVRGADSAHLALGLQSLEQRELRGDVDQVVHLVDVDVTEKAQGAIGLSSPFCGARVHTFVAT